MDLSFIVPIYNTPLKRLENCLNSILCIKGICYEVIMVDDGSESYVSEICKAYLKNNKQCKYIYKENGGVSSARNKGIDIAKGKYIAFVDSDDTIISTIYNTDFTHINADLIIFDMLLSGKNGDIVWDAFTDYKSGYVKISNVIKNIFCNNRLNSPCAKLFKREMILQENIRFNTKMKFAEDEDYILSFLKTNPVVYYQKEISYLYWRTEETGKKRLKLYPDTIINNSIAIHNKEQSMLNLMHLSEYEKKQYESMISQKKVKTLFNMLADLTILNEINDEIKEKVVFSIEEIHVNSIDNFSYKLKLEYVIIKRKYWIILRVISKLREVYLRKKGIQ